MPLQIPTKESNDIESYRRLAELRIYSNKGFKVNREVIERARDPNEYVTLGKLKSSHYLSGFSEWHKTFSWMRNQGMRNLTLNKLYFLTSELKE